MRRKMQRRCLSTQSTRTQNAPNSLRNMPLYDFEITLMESTSSASQPFCVSSCAETTRACPSALLQEVLMRLSDIEQKIHQRRLSWLQVQSLECADKKGRSGRPHRLYRDIIQYYGFEFRHEDTSKTSQPFAYLSSGTQSTTMGLPSDYKTCHHASDDATKVSKHTVNKNPKHPPIP